MTAFYQISKNKPRKSGNKKDDIRQRSAKNLEVFRDPSFEDLGFIRFETGWMYNLGPEFPVFSVAIVTNELTVGYQAESGSVRLFWPLWVKKTEIKADIDAAMASYANDDDLIDIDDYMLAGLPETEGPKVYLPGEYYGAEVV